MAEENKGIEINDKNRCQRTLVKTHKERKRMEPGKKGVRAKNKRVAFKTLLHKRAERAYVPIPVGCVLTLPRDCDAVRETLSCISTAIISLLHSLILLLYPSRSLLLSLVFIA